MEHRKMKLTKEEFEALSSEAKTEAYLAALDGMRTLEKIVSDKVKKEHNIK